MRLFAAVLPPQPAVRELAEAVDPLRNLPGAAALRWTQRAGWHFTLAFYGEVGDDVVPDLSARLARAAHRTPPFTLAVRGGGQFGQGRALWAGADGDLAALRLLAERAEAAGRKAGVAMEEHRRYRAHLTVARSGAAVEVPGYPRRYVEALGRFSGREWTVGELALVRSALPVSGVAGEQPRYDVVGRWGLGGGSGGGG